MADNAGSKKRTVLMSLAALAMAIPPAMNSVGNPHLAGMRVPDVLRLIAIGMWIGLALGIFFSGFIGGRRSG